MNYLKKIKSLFYGESTQTTLSNENYQDRQLSAKRSKQKGSIKHHLSQRTFRIEATMRRWKNAVTSAEDKAQPNRELLYQLYHAILDDDHLISQIRTARFSIQMAPFQITDNGKANEDLKKLFETPWFFELLEICFDSEMYGHSLVEIMETDDDGRIKSIYLVPREHVKPEKGLLVLDPSDQDGLLFREKPLNKQMIEIGKPDNLGLLKSISKSVIRKENNIIDWGTKNEKFGLPIVILKTGETNAKELDKKQIMLENFGSNLWLMLNDDDEFEIKEPISNTGGGHLTFKDFAAYMDKGIAMVINGQTGTSDEKSYAGSTEVHERVLNKYTLARLTRIQHWINFNLIPYLRDHYNYPFSNDTKYEFIDLLEEDLLPQTKATAPKEMKDTDKKKSQLSLDYFYPDTLSFKKPLFNLKALYEKAMLKIYDRKLKNSSIDKEIYLEEAGQLWKGAQKGIGTNIAVMKFTDPYLEVAQAIRRNLLTFAAFKNYASISEMVNHLTDEKGNIRSFSAFKKEALATYGDYGDRYLKVEYDAVVRSGEMAAQWKDYERDQDIFPNLQYKTQDDNNVRQSHAKLHNIIKPLNDPFWDSFFPPNGFGCRCYTLQSDKTANDDVEFNPKDEKVPEMFRHNVGKNGVIFGKKHPYFSNLKGVSSETITNQMRVILDDEDIYDLVFQNKNTIIKSHITFEPEILAKNLSKIKKLNGKEIIIGPKNYGKKVINILIDNVAKSFKLVE